MCLDKKLLSMKMLWKAIKLSGRQHALLFASFQSKATAYHLKQVLTWKLFSSRYEYENLKC
jgi:hypothetical protein